MRLLEELVRELEVDLKVLEKLDTPLVCETIKGVKKLIPWWKTRIMGKTVTTKGEESWI